MKIFFNFINKTNQLIKPVFIIFFFFILVFPLQAQNLVPNPSFEEYYWCPNYLNGYYIPSCKDWFMPTLGSSDYFNSCSTEIDGVTGDLLFSVPENYIGYQQARTGNAYGGYYAALKLDNDNYYEYISVELIQELESNTLYKLCYYLSLADSIVYSSNHLPQPYVNYSASYISQNAIYSNNDSKLAVTPQIISDSNIFLNDSLGWQKVEGYYTANGNEKFLTIGFFCNLNEIKYNYLLSGEAINPYYYIDDVSLEKIDINIPNCFTPNGDGINDFFEINMLPLNSNITIINRWGNVVFNSQKDQILFWDGKCDNMLCDEGTYFYRVTIGNLKKTGFIQLIR